MSIRITGLQEVATLQSGDFVAVDNTTTGTHKFDATQLGAGIEANLAPTYSSAATYNIGDFCMYNRVMYKCTTAITSPENWTASHWTQTSAGVALADKVDKVSGKGLSENDFTDALKTKLDGIQAGAEVNVQADWAQTDTSADDYIKNKPTDATTTTAGLMSAEDKVKLNGIQAGAEVNVQADWNETDSSADDYIKNKPSIATASTNGLMSSADKAKLDGIASGAEVNVQADWAQTNTSADDYIKNKPTAATASTTGLMSAADKAKLDSIEQGAEVNVQADWAQTDISADDYIKNKPVDATESVGGLMSAEDKAKLNGIESGAQVNVIDGVKVDGVALTPDANKDVDIVGKANQASIAEQYSTTATYVYDDYVIYDNTLYRCVADTSGTWDANDWEAVNIGDELEHKANIDGAYDDMTVGNAEQLVSSVAINEHQPYNFRPSGGSVDIGDRKTEEIVGGSLAWNQLVENGNFVDSTGWEATNGSFTISNNTVSFIASAENGAFRSSSVSLNVIPGHRYFLGVYLKTETATNKIAVYSWGYESSKVCAESTSWQFIGQIITAVQSSQYVRPIQVIDRRQSGFDSVQIKDAQIFDLTQMFGSTIADYLYTLETSTAGAGVARFRKYFPKPYYAYDAGSLQSVNLRSGVMTGLNQWDEEWESGGIASNGGTNYPDNTKVRSKNYIPVIGGLTYYIKSNIQLVFIGYNKNKEQIAAFNGYTTAQLKDQTFTFSDDCAYVRFYYIGTTYNNDICINLSWDGEYDGVYEPYIAHTYQYDPDLELRGIPKLDENNYLTYDGDVYESDGTVTRKCIQITLNGTENWQVAPISNALNNCFVLALPNLKGLAQSNNTAGSPNIKFVSSRYNNPAVIPSQDNRADVIMLTVANTDKYINIGWNSSNQGNLTAFKEELASNPVHLVYELETPTTEQADPYTNPQIVNDFGTESFIDSLVEAGTRDVSIPVGHNTKYLANLKAKLEMAPNSPDGDGKYIVQQTDGMNYYINFEPEIANKANVDGAYEDMTVGNAEQLLASVYTEDQIPYNFRQSGGGISVGDREIDKVVGGTVAWNQLSKPITASSSIYSVTVTPNSDGSVSLNGTSNDSGAMTSFLSITAVVGHKYFMYLSNDIDGLSIYTDIGGTISSKYLLRNATSTGNGDVLLRTDNNITYNNVKVWLNTIDLTVALGSTIADYIYTLEQNNAGDGVAWFRNLFPDPYYAYDAGSLQSVNTSAHEMVGFNQWDETQIQDGYVNDVTGNIGGDSNSKNTGYVKVLPNTAYYIKTEALSGKWGAWYDANKNYISGVGGDGIKTSPSNAHYIRFTVRYYNSGNPVGNPDTFCINLSHNGSRNGEYEPYVKHTYPLDSSLTLRGIPKLDSSNRLYYDGDSYASDGTVTRKYGIVDLGSLSFSLGSRTTGEWRASLSCQAKGNDIISNCVCAKYIAITPAQAWLGGISGIALNGSYVSINDSSYSDATSFNNALSGVYLVYELAEPTTETATTYQNPQVVNDWGTEEYVDYAYTQGTRDVAVPVGHYTEYLPNLRDKLQALPDAAGSNGTYVIEQTGGQMALTPLTTPKEIPDVPTSTDGTFALQATVSSGNVTYAWVSVT